MKIKLSLAILLGIFVLGPMTASGPGRLLSDLPLQTQPAFKVGELLSFRIYYGVVTAGRATLEITDGGKYDGKPTYHMTGLGWTTGMTDWFFRVRDRYETYVLRDKLLPVRFVRDIDEGGYTKQRDIYFNRELNTATDRLPKPPKRFDVPADVHDMMSAFYFARSLQTQNLLPGDEIPIKIFLDYEVFETRLKFKGRETIKTDLGRIPTMVFTPLVQADRVFKEQEGMTLYISDDFNKIPVRIQTDLRVGSIKVDITDAQNLRYPLRKL
jgi:hypothetical protein